MYVDKEKSLRNLKTETLISDLTENLNSLKSSESNLSDVVTHLKTSYEALDRLKQYFLAL